MAAIGVIVKSMESIWFQKLADIPDPSDGYSLVDSSVANDGSLLFLSIEHSGLAAAKATDTSGTATFPRPKMQEGKRFRLAVRRIDGTRQTIDLPELDLTFPLVDIFPDGRILLVGPRCSWRGHDDYDLNGVIFDPKSAQATRILLGDGIGSAYVDALGRIWVAYGDEGVFGNFGWGGPGPTAVGAAGLVCFSETGEKIWEYPANAIDTIDDCYALNVSGAEAAIFFYSDFPICRISSEFKVICWKTELSGCRAFAISKTSALFSGQYNDPSDIAYLGRFEINGLMSIRKVRLLLPDGSGLPQGKLLGRGKHLFFFDAVNAYWASLD